MSDVLNYVFLASRLQSASLQTKLLRHSSIVAYGSAFKDALCALNVFPYSLSQSRAQLAPRGLDVCMDLTGFSPLTQTKMGDFVHSLVVIDAAQRKRVKYETKCVDIGYGFLPFLFSSFGELEKDVVALLKRIQKFFIAQDIRARVVVHIFSRVSFVIARGARAQIVSRLPTNFLTHLEGYEALTGEFPNELEWETFELLRGEELTYFLNDYPIPDRFKIMLPTKNRSIFDAPRGRRKGSSFIFKAQFYLSVPSLVDKAASASIRNLKDPLPYTIRMDPLYQPLSRHPVDVQTFPEPILYMVVTVDRWVRSPSEPVIMHYGKSALDWFPSFIMNNNDVDAIPTQPVASAQPSQLVENTADSDDSKTRDR
ncbi:hypothetical protein Tco_0594243 [Tanacetum coccineum]